METLPIKRDLGLASLVSLVIALIMTVASVAGLLYGALIYPDMFRPGFVGNDATNLVVGLPILLASMWFARRGSLIGLLFWPGALFYVLYVYAFYVIGVPFNLLFLPYVALVTLSAYTLIGLIASIDGGAVRQQLTGIVPARTVGGILVGLAILVIAYDAFAAVTPLVSRTPVDPLMHVTWIVDFVVACPALLVGGVLLWQRETLGYVAAAGLLLLLDALFVSLFASQALGALFTTSLIDVRLIALDLGLALICVALLAFLVLMAARRQRMASLGMKGASAERAEARRERRAAERVGDIPVTPGSAASHAAGE